MSERFAQAMDALARSTSNAELSTPFLGLTQISGAAVSTLGEFLGSETLSATSRQAARLDEVQFDLGEGPCWDAMRLGRAVHEPAMRTSTRWPAFSGAIQSDDIASLFAFPLRVGSLRIGAVDLYSVEPMVLEPDESRQAHAMADVAGRQILQRALTEIGREHDEAATSVFSRRLVHQATGMVLAQLRITADDARLVIQGHAFARGESVMTVARRVVDGELDFSAEEDSDG